MTEKANDNNLGSPASSTSTPASTGPAAGMSTGTPSGTGAGGPPPPPPPPPDSSFRTPGKPVAPTTPRSGGTMKDEKGNDIPWTGEGKNGGTMPFSSCCLRPSDVKSLMAIEEKATKALPVTYAGEDEAEKMVDGREKPVFLQVFAAFIVKRIRKFGMESIFIFISPIDGEEYNIVDKPGMFTLEDVTEKVNKNFDQGIYDHFDEQHFIWSDGARVAS